ncbi:hypothetical protein F5887DRAFT_1072282 [Amanita rubescens]|nr:hypothetical protein F5887DRAFT_1072282 [Amanita rubescens]
MNPPSDIASNGGSTCSATSIKDAPKPFDSSALSDVILRSCDSIDFFVLWPLLRIVSSVFDDMFSFAAGATEEDMKDGLSIVSVSEDSETLLSLLSLIYPYDPEPETFCTPLFLKVCRAARKYSMDVIERKLRARLNNVEPPDKSVTGVARHFLLYSIAIQFGWRTEAAEAAQHTISTPLSKLPYNDELRNISGADFCEYLAFRAGSKTLHPAKKLSPTTIATRADKPYVDAKEPFDSSGKADVILRSSNRIDFFVLRDVLGLVTSAFDEVTSTSQKNGIPVIDVEEDGTTLRHLLLLIYPRVGSKKLDLDTFVKVGTAARRYRMVVVIKKLRQQLDASRHIVDDPIASLWVAIAFGWGQVAMKGARNALKMADGAKISRVKELWLVSAADVYWFIQYRSACRDAACKVLLKDELFASDMTRKEAAVAVRIIDSLKAAPRGSSIMEACGSSIDNPSKYEVRFINKVWKKREKLMTAVEDAISKVPLRLDFCVDGPPRYRKHIVTE